MIEEDAAGSHAGRPGRKIVTGEPFSAQADLLRVIELKTHFRTEVGAVRAVDGVSLVLERGKTLGVVGESGSGKTILSRSIMGLLPKHNVLSIREYMSLMTSNNLPSLDAFVTAMISVAVAIGFLVIFLSMYTTITERTREIGILKSLGASKRYIMGIILREAGLLCALGIVGGYAGTLIAKRVILKSFPTLSVELIPEWWLWAALLALAGTLMGASYPAFQAARLDPVDALAYE